MIIQVGSGFTQSDVDATPGQKAALATDAIFHMLLTVSEGLHLDRMTEFAVLMGCLIGWHMANRSNPDELITTFTEAVKTAPDDLRKMWEDAVRTHNEHAQRINRSQEGT